MLISFHKQNIQSISYSVSLFIASMLCYVTFLSSLGWPPPCCLNFGPFKERNSITWKNPTYNRETNTCDVLVAVPTIMNFVHFHYLSTLALHYAISEKWLIQSGGIQCYFVTCQQRFPFALSWLCACTKMQPTLLHMKCSQNFSLELSKNVRTKATKL